jgi:hypothetical protein
VLAFRRTPGHPASTTRSRLVRCALRDLFFFQPKRGSQTHSGWLGPGVLLTASARFSCSLSDRRNDKERFIMCASLAADSKNHPTKRYDHSQKGQGNLQAGRISSIYVLKMECFPSRRLLGFRLPTPCLQNNAPEELADRPARVLVPRTKYGIPVRAGRSANRREERLRINQQLQT